jgi:hypothetical protein
MGSLFFIINGYCATEETNSKYGEAPVIDGYIDTSSEDWDKISTVEIKLDDFPVDIRIMHNDKSLFISVQFEILIGYHSINEFVGLIISNSSSENKEDFIDAKIIQFTNISANEYNYLDYKINSSGFSTDMEINGDGAGKLEGITSTYEFSIPIKIDTENEEDAALDYGNSYAFNITYGETPVYPNGIKKSGIVLINIKSLKSSIPPITNTVLYVLSIIIFSVIGILLGLYIYRIFKLKEYMEKFKR